uniref:Uncharacterized protein n=1 Tax=Zea mays TaxID=4577 RepID=B6U668_MAIZE|nr:hypothetical protein [Zea mays]
MGQALRRLFDSFFSTREMRVVMLGLDAAASSAPRFSSGRGASQPPPERRTAAQPTRPPSPIRSVPCMLSTCCCLFALLVL